MKCKAKWLRSVQLWQVHCRECDIFTWHAYPPGDNRVILPHDIAVRHIQRYHKE